MNAELIEGNKPRIAFVTYQLGAVSEVWLLRQIKGFSKVTPVIFTWHNLGTWQDELNGIEICELDYEMDPMNRRGVGRWVLRLLNFPGGNFYASAGKEKRHIRKLLSEYKIEGLLCQFGWSALRFTDIAKDLDIPLVVHFHGRDLSVCMRNRWYRSSIKNRINQFDRLVIVGSHQEQKLFNIGADHGKIYRIPCGVPCEQFEPSEEKADGEFVYISVGRLTEEKGLEFSIRAFSRVAEKHSDVKMLIIGDGPLRTDLERLGKEEGVRDKIEFTGNVSPAEVKRYLNNSSVFIQHSIVSTKGDEEGAPVSIAEGCACGLPVVVTDCGGITDQVIDGVTGFVVQQRDVDTMAERMIQLYEDSELREKMGNAGRVRMEEYFDTEKQISKLEDVILDAVRQKSKDY